MTLATERNPFRVSGIAHNDTIYAACRLDLCDGLASGRILITFSEISFIHLFSYLFMKVNYRTHAILEKLEKESLGIIRILEQDGYFFRNLDGGKTLNESFKRNCQYFKEIVYISPAFLDASISAFPKLAELYKDIAINDIADLSVNGTFIVGELVFFITHKIKKGLDFQETCFFIFDKSGTPLAFYEAGIGDREGFFGWISNCYSNKIECEDDTEQFFGQKIMSLVLISMFRSYASVETKYVAPKSKINYEGKCRNDTNLGITYLTSKWFTNLVRSEGFKVRGHFRLQPKKNNDGEWTKELIWIDSFEKSGYTSKAQILNH